jgi:hypothetical protein
MVKADGRHGSLNKHARQQYQQNTETLETPHCSIKLPNDCLAATQKQPSIAVNGSVPG